MMDAFFALGDAGTAQRMLGGRRVLYSYAYVGTPWLPSAKLAAVAAAATCVMVDSGAFTAWRSGRPVDLGRYAQYLATVDFDWAISLDVIGDADASVRNWESMRPMVRGGRLMPVWHEGDPVDHLLEYVANSDRVCLGRVEGRRSKLKTMEFYDSAFNRCPDAKFHALGNASPDQLEPYPFESFDSTSWQRDSAYSNALGWPYSRCSKETRMRAYIEATETMAHVRERQMRIVWAQPSVAE